MTLQPTLHASAVVVGETCLIIRGPSGAGKSSLAFALIEAARRHGDFAAFVSDDRIEVRVSGGRVIATAPATIAGMAERFGRGVEAVDHVPSAVVRLVVDLVESSDMSRMPQPSECRVRIADIALPRQAVPRRHIAASLPLVMAALRDVAR